MLSRLLLTWGRGGCRSARPAETLNLSRRWLSYYKDSRGYEHFAKPALSARARSSSMMLYGAGAAVVFGAYYVRSIEEIPYTHRTHALLFVSQQQEKMLGEHVFEEVKREAAQNNTLLPENHSATRLVRKIGTKIAEVAVDGYGGGNVSHMKGLNWEFAVIDSPEANAFVVPGGKVVVYTGLLDLLKTEDELASVMAHEAAHVLARHQAERMSQMGLLTVVRMFMWLLFGITLPNAAVVLGIILPYSRRAETEADLIGIRLMARACYDPTAATSMLHKLHHAESAHQQHTGVSVPSLLRTHPLSEKRVQDVKANLPEAIRVLQASECDTTTGSFIKGMASFFR